jgi:uncharacterized membrane protein
MNERDDGLAGREPREPDPPVPDRIPDDIAARYASDARRSIRYHRSRRYAIGSSLRHSLASLRDRDVVLLAAIVFLVGLFVIALVAALIYALILWPAAAVLVLVGLIFLFAGSVMVALRLGRRRTASGPASDPDSSPVT